MRSSYVCPVNLQTVCQVLYTVKGRLSLPFYQCVAPSGNLDAEAGAGKGVRNCETALQKENSILGRGWGGTRKEGGNRGCGVPKMGKQDLARGLHE